MPAQVIRNTSSFNNLFNDFLLMSANTGLPEPYSKVEKKDTLLDNEKFEKYANEMEELLKNDPLKFTKVL